MSNLEKEHYRELFLALANKLITEKKVLVSTPVAVSEVECEQSPRNIN